MKITLTNEAIEAGKKLVEQFRTKNQFAQKRISPLVNALIIDAYTFQNATQLDRISQKAVSHKAQKKVVLKSIEMMIEERGLAAVEALLNGPVQKKRGRKPRTVTPDNLVSQNLNSSEVSHEE